MSVDLAADLWLLLAALGLNLAVAHGGLPFLGQGAFVAAGAYGTLLLAEDAGWPQGLALAAATLGAALAGWVLAGAARRLEGGSLALASWGLAWLAYAVLVAFPDTFGGAQGLVRPAPAVLESRFLGLTWRLTPSWHIAIAGTLCLLAVVATRGLVRGPIGRDLALLREGPAVARSLGVATGRLQRGVVAVSAALAAVAGGATALLLGLVAPADVSPLLSLELYVAVLIGGTAGVLGPVMGVAIVTVLPDVADRAAELLDVAPAQARGVLTAALLLAVLALRPTLARATPFLGDLPVVRRLVRRRAAAGPADEPPEDHDRRVGTEGSSSVLVARGLCVRYGEVVALDGLDLDVRTGEVHALVGPNGSGKTTAMRVLAGTIRPASGEVQLDGSDLTSTDERGHVLAGVVRTFQRTVLPASIAAGAQVLAGARAMEGRGLLRPLLRTPSWQRRHGESARLAQHVLRLTALDGRAGAVPAQLTYGEQRLLQLARAVATGARVVLLDEPAAGMDRRERDLLATVVRALAGIGVGVLLVEHDMRLVGQLADRVTVLAAGKVVTSGTPAEIRRDPEVRRAYLGEDAA